MSDRLRLCREISVVDFVNYREAIDTVCVQSAERFNEKSLYMSVNVCGLKGVTGVTLKGNRDQEYF